jgi:hypothetical protein
VMTWFGPTIFFSSPTLPGMLAVIAPVILRQATRIARRRT